MAIIPEHLQLIMTDLIVPAIKQLVKEELKKINELEEQVSKQQIEIENLRQLVGSKLLKKLMEV